MNTKDAPSIYRTTTALSAKCYLRSKSAHQDRRLPRSDYCWLNVFSIDLPPLCERRQDIPALVEHFLTNRQIGKVRCKIDPDAMRALLNHDWPGNIRELANVLERAQILAEENLITLDDLPDGMQVMLPPAENSSTDPLNLSELEGRAVRAALDEAKGNKARAAKSLGISRRSLYRFIEKYRLEEHQVEAEADSVARE